MKPTELLGKELYKAFLDTKMDFEFLQKGRNFNVLTFGEDAQEWLNLPEVDRDEESQDPELVIKQAVFNCCLTPYTVKRLAEEGHKGVAILIEKSDKGNYYKANVCSINGVYKVQTAFQIAESKSQLTLEDELKRAAAFAHKELFPKPVETEFYKLAIKETKPSQNEIGVTLERLSLGKKTLKQYWHDHVMPTLIDYESGWKAIKALQETCLSLKDVQKDDLKYVMVAVDLAGALMRMVYDNSIKDKPKPDISPTYLTNEDVWQMIYSDPSVVLSVSNQVRD